MTRGVQVACSGHLDEPVAPEGTASMARRKAIVLLLPLILLAAVQPGLAEDTRIPPSQARPAPTGRFRHLEGRYEVRDARLKAIFDAAVVAVVSLQAKSIRDQARALVEDRTRHRFERREPLGALDLRQLQPAHVPAMKLVQFPL